MKRVCLSLPVVVLLFFLVDGCGSSPHPIPQRFFRTNLFLETVYTVEILSSRPNEEVYPAYNQVVRELTHLEDVVSFDIPDSEINRINCFAFQHPVEMSPEFCCLLQTAHEFYQKTDHKFDITVQPLLQLWGFYRRKQEEPDPHLLASTVNKTGFQNISINWKKQTVFFQNQTVKLDFGGFIKGYALDRCVTILRSAGFKNFFINFGRSSQYGLGPGTGAGWIVNIALPGEDRSSNLKVYLDGVALSVSFGSVGWHSQDGIWHSMIIDPGNGFPVNGPEIVMVISDLGAQSDAWSTALCVHEDLMEQKLFTSYGLQAVAILNKEEAAQFYPSHSAASSFFLTTHP